MKRSSAAFFVLASFLLAPAARAACSPCTAVLVPGASFYKIPQPGWIEPGTTAYDVSEWPEYGTWAGLTVQTYTPAADFWNVGLDRMKVDVLSGAPVDIRSVMLVAGTPTEETDSDVFGTPLVFAGGTGGATGSTSLYLDDRGNQPGVAQVGGRVTTRVDPPDGGHSGTRSLIALAGLFHVELDTSSDDPKLVAVADAAAFGCTGAGCRTPGIILPEQEHLYEIKAGIGNDVLGVPTADVFTLRLTVCSEALAGCQTTELRDLLAVDLDSEQDMEIGLLDGDTRAVTVKLDEVVLWRLVKSQDDLETSSYAGFPANDLDGYWTPLGAVISSEWGNSHLAGMTFGSVATLRDDRPGAIRRFRATFDLDTGALALADTESLVALFGQADTALAGTTKSFDLFVKKIGNDYYLRGRAIKDDATVAPTALVPLAPGVNTVTVHFYAGSAANSGFLKMRVGAGYGSVTGVNNPNRRVDRYSIGASQPTLFSNFSPGTLRFDNVTTHFHY